MRSQPEIQTAAGSRAVTHAGKAALPHVLILLLLTTLPYVWSAGCYFYEDDGPVLLQARQVRDEGWSSAFDWSLFHRFRPLRYLSISLIYALFGGQSVVPYHLLSLGLHVINAFLAWWLLRKLLGRAGETWAFQAACVFAVHWAASEAVTYLSAIGVLWCMLGTMMACCGVVALAEGKSLAACLLMTSGLFFLVGGGEYGVATVPLIFGCALWKFNEEPLKARVRRAVKVLALMVPVFAGYFFFLSSAVRGVEVSEVQLGWQIVTRLADSIGRLALPSAWVDEKYSVGVVLVLAILGLAKSRRGSVRVFRLPLAILLLGAVSTLLIFSLASFSANRFRFLYIPAPFFLAWLIGLLSDLWRRRSEARSARLTHGHVWLSVFILLNVIHLNVRVWKLLPRSEAVRFFVATVRNVVEAHPAHRVRVWLLNDDREKAAAVAVAFRLVEKEQVSRGIPSGHPGENEIWLLVKHAYKKGFDIRIEPAEARPELNSP